MCIQIGVAGQTYCRWREVADSRAETARLLRLAIEPINLGPPRFDQLIQHLDQMDRPEAKSGLFGQALRAVTVDYRLDLQA